MKLFHWDDALSLTLAFPGSVIVMANSLEEARQMIKDRFGNRNRGIISDVMLSDPIILEAADAIITIDGSA